MKAIITKLILFALCGALLVVSNTVAAKNKDYF